MIRCTRYYTLIGRTVVKRLKKQVCMNKPVKTLVFLNVVFSFRFTPGAGLQAEKVKTGPSAADVEAIKVPDLCSNGWDLLQLIKWLKVCLAHRLPLQMPHHWLKWRGWRECCSLVRSLGEKADRVMHRDRHYSFLLSSAFISWLGSYGRAGVKMSLNNTVPQWKNSVFAGLEEVVSCSLAYLNSLDKWCDHKLWLRWNVVIENVVSLTIPQLE